MKSFILIIISICIIGCAPPQTNNDTSTNQLGPIATKFKSNANQLMHAAMTDKAGFERLTEMCDTFGPRFSGSENLEKSIDWILKEMKYKDTARKPQRPSWQDGLHLRLLLVTSWFFQL